MTDHLDPGYAAAAAHQARAEHSSTSTRTRAIGVLIAGLLLVGLVFGIAVRRTEDSAAGIDQARAGLQGDIQRAQSQQAALAASASDLAAEIRATQSALGAGGVLSAVDRLALQGGFTPVTGPGLAVVIDGASAGSGGGVILDKDIQLLVNSLWSAGAEAITVGGVRLRATSAIRQAGSAILVDNRPVFWPITIQAVGDQAKLHVNLVSTAGFGRFSSFVSVYDIRFDVTAQNSMSLVAAAGMELKYASDLPTAPAAPRSGPTTTR